MPTKKKATQKQKQKQSQVVNIHIGDKGGKKKRRPRVVRNIPKQPIVVNVSTPQMSIPSFENRTFLDGAKFSSSVPINELVPVKVPEKVAEKIPVKVPVPTNIRVPNLLPFSSISTPPQSPFSLISPMSSTPTSNYVPQSPYSLISPISSISLLQDSYPVLPFSDQEKEQVERKKMGMEETLTRIKNNLLREQSERNLMGMEDINSRLQNDMFNEDKQRNLVEKEDLNVSKYSVMPPRRKEKELRESYSMGLEDPTTPKKALSKLNKIELQELAKRIGIQLTDASGYQREKKELQDMIRQSGYKNI